MSNITQKIKTLQIVYPQVYSYILPDLPPNKGSQKIGYTGQEKVHDRIRPQVETPAFKLKYELLWSGPAFFEGGKESFIDKTFHKFLVGVITINVGDYMPVDQWYLLRGEENEDVIFYYNELETCKEVMDKLLEGYDITFEDGILNEDGSLAWVLIHLNGYTSTVWFHLRGSDALVTVYTYEDEPDNSLNK